MGNPKEIYRYFRTLKHSFEYAEENAEYKQETNVEGITDYEPEALHLCEAITRSYSHPSKHIATKKVSNRTRTGLL